MCTIFDVTSIIINGHKAYPISICGCSSCHFITLTIYRLKIIDVWPTPEDDMFTWKFRP